MSVLSKARGARPRTVGLRGSGRDTARAPRRAEFQEEGP
jgi:hypothetical protein